MLLSLRVLKHPNISPALINDVEIKGTLVPAVTIPIYENGDIHSFLRLNPYVDRSALVSISRRSPYVYQAADEKASIGTGYCTRSGVPAC